MADDRELPKGRLRRLSQLARVGARTGAVLLGAGDGEAAARQAVALLGNLRGLAAKVGQMASYVDGFLPQEHGETYARLLAPLQSAAVHSPFSEVRALLEQELGGPLEQRFASFDPQPVASASIGQVHRARLHDGRAVAVKVQHPGIAEAMEADLQSGGVIATLAGAFAPKNLQPEAIYEELAARFREELDYALEARRQHEFCGFFSAQPAIHVPAVVSSHCTKRVLTTEFVHGLRFEQATQCDEPLRRSYAEVLWHFVFTSVLVHGTFNADPHPGNYLFHEDGRVTFLDFGCMQTVSPVYLTAARAMHQAALAGDRALFDQAVRCGLATVSGAYESALSHYLWRCLEPIMTSPYRMERSYVAAVVRQIQELKQHMFSKASRATAAPAGVMLLNRLQFGFYSVLARLDVPADYAGAHRQIIERAQRE